MNLTEAEARESWCPFARVPRGRIDRTFAMVAVNRTDDGFREDAAHCLGPRCMAWRWHDAAQERVRSAAGPSPDSREPEPLVKPKGEGWVLEPYHIADGQSRVWRRDAGASRRGHCGLAGSAF